MVPTAFEGENQIFGPPPGVSDEEVQYITGYVGPDANGVITTITCWKLEKDEIEELLRTGRIFLWQWLGGGCAPHALTVHSPFERKSDAKPNPEAG